MTRWPAHWKQFSCPTQQLSHAKDTKSPSHQAACRAEHGATQAKHLAFYVYTQPPLRHQFLLSVLLFGQYLSRASGTVRARPPGPTVDTSNACLCAAPPDGLAGTVRSTLQVKGCPAHLCLLPVPLVVSPQPASGTNSPPPHPRE